MAPDHWFGSVEPHDHCFGSVWPSGRCFGSVEPHDPCFASMRPPDYCFGSVWPPDHCFRSVWCPVHCFRSVWPPDHCFGSVWPPDHCFGSMWPRITVFSLVRPLIGCGLCGLWMYKADCHCLYWFPSATPDMYPPHPSYPLINRQSTLAKLSPHFLSFLVFIRADQLMTTYVKSLQHDVPSKMTSSGRSWPHSILN